jgi:hypothetical protein
MNRNDVFFIIKDGDLGRKILETIQMLFDVAM